MATVYISEFKNAASPIGTYAPDVLPQPAITNQALGFTGAGTLSSAFSASTYAVLVVGDTTKHRAVFVVLFKVRLAARYLNHHGYIGKVGVNVLLNGLCLRHLYRLRSG